MKIFFMSDIHGSSHFLNKAIECYKKEGAQYMVILGDALYHGPRNHIPMGYNPKEVAEKLNFYRNNIIAVRGNCDSEVDQMLINYPMMSDYNTIFLNNRRIFLTHGHLYNKDNMPPLVEGDIFIYGHTHIPLIETFNGITMINPGSISIPKGESENSYGILEEGVFTIKNLEGKIILEEEI